MNNKIVKIFCCLLLLLLGTSVFAASKTKSNDIPSWLLNPTEEYPDSKYLTYIGEASDRSSAELAAVKGIASVFGQNVVSNSRASSHRELSDIGGKESYNSTSNTDTDVLSKVNIDNIIGIEIKGFWFESESSRWYAFAVLDKEKSVAVYKDIIIKNSSTINKLLLNAKKDIYSLESYCAYDFAQRLAEENRQIQAIISVLDFTASKAYAKYVISPDNIATEKFEIAKQIPISVTISGDNGKYASVFLKALADLGFKGKIGEDDRYVLSGNLAIEEEGTSNGKTTKVYYTLESFLIDTNTDVELFPIIIKGRQSHRTVEQAMLRVENDITKKINSTFKESFDKYIFNFNLE